MTAGAFTPAPLEWREDDLFAIGETTFRVLPDAGFWGDASLRMEGADFLVAKPKWLIERYARLLEELRPERIFELGIFQGGSTALLLELTRPKRLVAIDRMRKDTKLVEEFASARGLEDAVRIRGRVDQADRETLTKILAEDFGDAPLDLVIDDCSHLYELTKASFNLLFPRLRPGGLYAIEDWPWAHTPLGFEPLEGLFPDEVPLSRIVFELVLAVPALPGLIDEVTVDLGVVVVRRGDRELDPTAFDISACSNPRGREMLAPIPPASENPGD